MHHGPAGRRAFTGLFVLLAGRLAAQQIDPNAPMPIDVKVSPGTTYPGGTVKVTGTTLADGKRMTVTVVVTPPSGKPLPPVIAKITPAGGYAVTVKGGDQTGDYTITATAPDNKGTAKAGFRVTAPGGTADELAATWKRPADLAEEALEIAEEAADLAPPSPATQELKDTLAVLKQKLVSRTQAGANVRQALAVIAAAVQKTPQSGTWLNPVFDRLRPWADTVEERVRQAELEKMRIRQELDQSKQGSKQVCETINSAIEGINLLGAMMKLVDLPLGIGEMALEGPIKVLGSLATGFLSSSAPGSGAGQVAAKQAVEQSLGVLGQGTKYYGDLASASKIGMSVLSDIAGLGAASLYRKYCEKFEGSFSGELSVAFDKNADVWWKNSYAIAGTLRLRYAKPKEEKQAVYVKGEFIGSGVKFTVWQDALNILYPKLMRGARVIGTTTPPMGFPYIGSEGAYAGSLGPRAFFVPVEGELVGTQLTLRVLEAKTDFKNVTADAKYLVLSPLTLVPVAVVWGLPYQGAQFLIIKAMDTETGRDVELTVTIDRAARTMVIQKQYDRKNVQGQGWAANFAMTLHVCNPKC
jgi:hypothetical protein